MTMPGFSAEATLYRSTARYAVNATRSFAAGAPAVQPQFRSQVRRQCGRCVNRRRDCFLVGYECTVEPGVPGSPELGIPPSPGHVRCEPEVFREWQERC